MGTAAERSFKPLYDGLAVTREEYLELEEDGFKYDMIDGVLHLSPSADSNHANFHHQFSVDLGIFNRSADLGKVYPELDIFLPDGGDVLRPDLCFVLTENLDIVRGHVHGVPDLVLEILSPSTRKRDLGIKAERYLKNGVREYWLIDPRAKTIQVWINRGDKWSKREGDSLASELLEGFEVKAADLFGQ